MATEEISKKLETIRDILNSKYGWLGVSIMIFVVMGKLSPDESAHAINMLGLIVEKLNNAVGVSLVVVVGLFGASNFVHKLFFKPYIDEKTHHTRTLQSLESNFQNFTSNCTVLISAISGHGERLSNIEGGVVDLISQMADHEKRVDRVLASIDNRFIPAFEKIAEKFEE